MARTRVRRRRLAALILAAAGISLLGGPVAAAVGLGEAPAAAPAPLRTYLVEPGDTLWTIASTLEPATDPRPVVDALARANDVDPGALVPGQELVVPANG